MEDSATLPRRPLKYYAIRLEKYCLENNILIKILCIIDNAVIDLPFNGDIHPNIKVVVFLQISPFWFQPMD